MIALISFLLATLASPFRSKSDLVAENELLRQQVLVLRRRVKGRVPLRNGDRWFFVQRFPSILSVLAVIQPETLVRWHRAGFRLYWRWKSRPRGRTDFTRAAREFGQGQSWLTCNDEVDRLRTFALLVGLDIIADLPPQTPTQTRKM